MSPLRQRMIDAMVLREMAQRRQEAYHPRWLGATPAFSLVQHTWTPYLRIHLHVHALITCRLHCMSRVDFSRPDMIARMGR